MLFCISYSSLIFRLTEFMFFQFFVVFEYTHGDHLCFVYTKKVGKNVVMYTFIDSQFNRFV